jgi:hypothetical protein
MRWRGLTSSAESASLDVDPAHISFYEKEKLPSRYIIAEQINRLTMMASPKSSFTPLPSFSAEDEALFQTCAVLPFPDPALIPQCEHAQRSYDVSYSSCAAPR